MSSFVTTPVVERCSLSMTAIAFFIGVTVTTQKTASPSWEEGKEREVVIRPYLSFTHSFLRLNGFCPSCLVSEALEELGVED